MTARLTATGLRVVRSGRTVLEVDRLEVHEGEVLGIIGPNGAGKSTLLQALALLERPASGEIAFEGAPVRGRELAYRRRMAVVFQDPLLLDGGVEHNVTLGLRLRGVPAKERRARARRWLERFGVAGLAGRHVRALSGGEAQRVSLARAFALEPEVLFLDEPFSSLDAPTREALLSDLDGVLRETRTATVFVTHDRDEALRLSDRVAVLMAGRVRQVGPAWEVFAAPADGEVAAFVGVETVVPGRVAGVSDGLARVAVGEGITVWAPAPPVPAAEVLVCLRPENVAIAPAGEPAEAGSVRNRLPGTVVRVVPAGFQARVELDCGFRLSALITGQSLRELALRPGDRVTAAFKATAVHLIPHAR
ncbi:MAG TPA: ABC transporter ATP-binding protein [Dehalococcoidia bacterium]